MIERSMSRDAAYKLRTRLRFRNFQTSMEIDDRERNTSWKLCQTISYGVRTGLVIYVIEPFDRQADAMVYVFLPR